MSENNHGVLTPLLADAYRYGSGQSTPLQPQLDYTKKRMADILCSLCPDLRRPLADTRIADAAIEAKTNAIDCHQTSASISRSSREEGWVKIAVPGEFAPS
jgi:hypothetical protein